VTKKLFAAQKHKQSNGTATNVKVKKYKANNFCDFAAREKLGNLPKRFKLF